MDIRPLLLACALTLPFAAVGDDLRVAQLEQEVRRLERQIQSLSRRVDEVERPAFDAARPASPAASSPAPPEERWLDASKWRRVKVGMSELELVELLGAPTSMREESGGRVLLYALEVGSSGFLGGSVRMRDGKVIAAETPRLK
jgi:hypothetical protein